MSLNKYSLFPLAILNVNLGVSGSLTNCKTKKNEIVNS